MLAGGAGLLAPACRSARAASSPGPAAAPSAAPLPATRPAVPDHADAADALHADLDRIFDDPLLARALLAVRVDALDDGRTLYVKNADTLVMPASNMKIVTMAVAAETLGWGYRYITRLEAAGRVADGTLHGDLVVVGGGDPSIGSPDAGDAALFGEWAEALHHAGIDRVDGRIIGDDRAFADEGPGAGWSWDYLADGYAAPTSALSYNENVSVVHISPGAEAGAPAIVSVTPPGHQLNIANHVVTAARGTTATITFQPPAWNDDARARRQNPGRERAYRADGGRARSHEVFCRSAAHGSRDERHRCA